jgi:beta-glucosidase-like glycosyl hydrolase
MLGGEDTTLAARLGVAFTRGIQRGSVPESKYRMVNTIAKHLSAYSGPEGYCGGVSVLAADSGSVQELVEGFGAIAITHLSSMEILN